MTLRRYRHLPDLTIASGASSLRCVQDDDIEPIRQWRNAQMDVLRQDRPISADRQRAYFAREIWPQMEAERPSTVLLSFRRDDELVGYGGLVHIAWEHSRAEISVLMRSDIAGDEVAYHPLLRTFLFLVRELAFNRLGLNRVYLETYSIRTKHIATLEACGFQLEGRLREHVRIDGAPADSLIHACFAREWTTWAAG